VSQTVLWGECRAGMVTRLWVPLNPDKVAGLDRPLDLR
jgi:hypothetical protein